MKDNTIHQIGRWVKRMEILRPYHSIMVLLFLSLISYFMGYFVNAFISHQLTPGSYGDFSITMRIIVILSILILGGTNVTSVQYLSEYFETENRTRAGAYLRWNVRKVRVTTLVSLAVFFLFFLFLVIMHLLSIHRMDAYHYSVYAFFLAPFSALYMLLASIMLSFKWNKTYFFFDKIAANTLLALWVLTVLYLLGTTIDYFNLVVLTLLSFCMVFIIEGLILFRKLHRLRTVKHPDTDMGRVESGEKRLWAKDATNFTFIQLVNKLVFVIDLLIVDWVVPGKHHVGLYAAMLVIGGILWESPRAVTSFLAPRISPLLKEKRYNDLQKLVNRVNLISMGISGVLLLIIILFSRFFLSLFGPGYTSAQLPLIILSLAYFIGSTSLSGVRVLLFLHSKTMLQINIMEVILLIAGGVMLTFFFGITGMSVAVLLSTASKSILVYFQVRKRLPVNPYGFSGMFGRLVS